jgi:thiamine-monophosphate kinase
MKLSDAGERAIVREIISAVRRNPSMLADFEEDAAIVSLEKGSYAITTDMGMAGTHFLTDEPDKIGKKIVVSNATDLLSKGAVPEYMLVSLGLPASYGMEFVKRLYASMDRELSRFGAHIIGGDTNSFVYSVTMIGKVVKPLLRKGAKAGDCVVLTGQVGNAAAGYVALRRKMKAHPALIKAQLEPDIDFKLCKEMMKSANAGIDVSDGLAYELSEIARLSGKRIVVEWEKIPVHPALGGFCTKNGLDIKDMVFHHGEDYQIVYTTKDSSKGIVIGRVEEGSGVYLERDGRREKLAPKGYEHFRSN